MVGKSKAATKQQKRRFDAISQIGCIPCRFEGYYGVPCQVQHVVEGAYRRGHDYTYGCCPWHHQGQPPNRLTDEDSYRILGPSLAKQGKEYKERYGTEQELVSEQNKLIEEWEDSIV